MSETELQDDIKLAQAKVDWPQEPIDNNLTVADYLRAHPDVDPELEEIADATEFLAGVQWDSVIKKQRLLDGRPCLTVNRVEGYYASALAASHRAREYPTQRDLEVFTVILYRKLKHAQCIFNFMLSGIVEMAALNRRNSKPFNYVLCWSRG
jgi:hypothetical protein